MVWETIKDWFGFGKHETSHEAHRERIERVVREVKPNAKVISRERANSIAHSERGAIDISVNNVRDRHALAKAISVKLHEEFPEDKYDVIVETVNGDKQTDITYRDGHKGRTVEKDKNATGDHIHIEHEPNK